MDETKGIEKRGRLRLRDKLKETLQENNAVTQSITVVFLILILVGLFAFITIGLRFLGLFTFPAFIEYKFFPVNGDPALIISERSDIYDYLTPGINENRGFVVEISLENVRGIISGTHLPDNLHLETTARFFADGAPVRTVRTSFWRKEDKHKYILRSNGTTEETYINNGVYEYIRNHITASSARRAASENFSFGNVPHVKDINYYLNLLYSGEITDYTIHREIEEDIEENIIIIEYEIAELGQREVIRISLDTGIVLRVRSYAGGVLFYDSVTSVTEAYFTGHEPEITAITSDLFLIG